MSKRSGGEYWVDGYGNPLFLPSKIQKTSENSLIVQLKSNRVKFGEYMATPKLPRDSTHIDVTISSNILNINANIRGKQKKGSTVMDDWKLSVEMSDIEMCQVNYTHDPSKSNSFFILLSPNGFDLIRDQFHLNHTQWSSGRESAKYLELCTAKLDTNTIEKLNEALGEKLRRIDTLTATLINGPEDKIKRLKKSGVTMTCPQCLGMTTEGFYNFQCTSIHFGTYRYEDMNIVVVPAINPDSFLLWMKHTRDERMVKINLFINDGMISLVQVGPTKIILKISLAGPFQRIKIINKISFEMGMNDQPLWQHFQDEDKMHIVLSIEEKTTEGINAIMGFFKSIFEKKGIRVLTDQNEIDVLNSSLTS